MQAVRGCSHLCAGLAFQHVFCEDRAKCTLVSSNALEATLRMPKGAAGNLGVAALPRMLLDTLQCDASFARLLDQKRV